MNCLQNVTCGVGVVMRDDQSVNNGHLMEESQEKTMMKDFDISSERNRGCWMVLSSKHKFKTCTFANVPSTQEKMIWM